MNLSDIVSRPPEALNFRLKMNITPLERAVTSVLNKYGGLENREEDPRELEERLADFENRHNASNWKLFPWHKASDLFRARVSNILMNTFEDTDRTSFCRAGIDVYIATYDEQSPILERLRSALKKKMADNLPLDEAFIREFDFFNPDAAPALLGAEMARQDNPYLFLKSQGVSSPHATGLFEEAFLEMLDILKSDLRHLEEGSFYKVMHWLQPNPSTTAVTTRAEGIEAIVLPLEDEKSNPLRDVVERFLIGAFGDPRVNRAEWKGVGQKALAIINRWLTSKSLKMFFDIINKFEDSHMWESRREFWMAMDRRELIDQAWVVLNPEGEKHARQLGQEYDDNSFLSHGSVAFPERDKCFFIMKIGDLTVVEGTHNFKVRIYDGDIDNPPPLWEEAYKKSVLYADPDKTGEGVSYTHDSSDRWMQKTDNYIRLNR